jgi:hypothetical protein
MKGSKILLMVLVLLGLAALACDQAGEVLTPADATVRAVEGIPVFEIIEGTGGSIEVGDVVEVEGQGFLINIQASPGGSISGSIPRGAVVSVLDIATFEGENWYRVSSDAGEGWVPGARVTVVEPVETETGIEADAEDEGELEPVETTSGPQAGDTINVTGTAFLVNIMESPSSGRIVGGLSRNSPAVVLEVARFEGTLWYHVDSDAGQGWLPEQNIVTDDS